MSDKEKESTIKIFQAGYKEGYEQAWKEIVAHFTCLEVKYKSCCPLSDLEWVESCLRHGFDKKGLESYIKLAEEIEKILNLTKQEIVIKVFLVGFKEGFENAWRGFVARNMPDEVEYVGSCPSNDLDAIESSLKRGFEIDRKLVEELEKIWITK